MTTFQYKTYLHIATTVMLDIMVVVSFEGLTKKYLLFYMLRPVFFGFLISFYYICIS